MYINGIYDTCDLQYYMDQYNPEFHRNLMSLFHVCVLLCDVFAPTLLDHILLRH